MNSYLVKIGSKTIATFADKNMCLAYAQGIKSGLLTCYDKVNELENTEKKSIYFRELISNDNSIWNSVHIEEEEQ